MTAVDPHHVAASLTQDALAAVFDPASVALLREDSPLSAVGLTDADMVAVADAIAEAAAREGLVCILTDADVSGVTTVSDLIAGVVAQLATTQVAS